MRACVCAYVRGEGLMASCAMDGFGAIKFGDNLHLHKQPNAGYSDDGHVLSSFIQDKINKFRVTLTYPIKDLWGFTGVFLLNLFSVTRRHEISSSCNIFLIKFNLILHH